MPISSRCASSASLAPEGRRPPRSAEGPGYRVVLDPLLLRQFLGPQGALAGLAERAVAEALLQARRKIVQHLDIASIDVRRVVARADQEGLVVERVGERSIGVRAELWMKTL